MILPYSSRSFKQIGSHITPVLVEQLLGKLLPRNYRECVVSTNASNVAQVPPYKLGPIEFQHLPIKIWKYNLFYRQRRIIDDHNSWIRQYMRVSNLSGTALLMLQHPKKVLCHELMK